MLISCFGGAVLYCCSAVLTREPDEVRCPQQLFDTRCAGGNRLATTSETRFGAMMQQHRVSPAKYRSTSCPAYGSLAFSPKMTSNNPYIVPQPSRLTSRPQHPSCSHVGCQRRQPSNTGPQSKHAGRRPTRHGRLPYGCLIPHLHLHPVEESAPVFGGREQLVPKRVVYATWRFQDRGVPCVCVEGGSSCDWKAKTMHS